jgi:hypothetical protein
LYYINGPEEDSVGRCEEEKYLTLEQASHLEALAKKEDVTDLLLSPEYIIFRSWLKGGLVVQKRVQELIEAKDKIVFEKNKKNFLEL